MKRYELTCLTRKLSQQYPDFCAVIWCKSWLFGRCRVDEIFTNWKHAELRMAELREKAK